LVISLHCGAGQLDLDVIVFLEELTGPASALFIHTCVTLLSARVVCCQAHLSYVRQSLHTTFAAHITSVHCAKLLTKFLRVLDPSFINIQLAKLLVTNGCPPLCGIHAKIAPSATPVSPFTPSA
jgi:hypothetical protein